MINFDIAADLVNRVITRRQDATPSTAVLHDTSQIGLWYLVCTRRKAMSPRVAPLKASNEIFVCDVIFVAAIFRRRHDVISIDGPCHPLVHTARPGNTRHSYRYNC